METIKIVTCNARVQTPIDGDQQFIKRVGFLSDKLNELDADVIAFQELTSAMRLELIARMPKYGFLGAGRAKDRLGEGAVIAYKQNKLMPERLISDMLSYTPHISGSTYGLDQSDCPRIFSSCDFMPILGGEPFRVMNIHTDHIGAKARLLEVKQFLDSYFDQESLRPMPTIICGDFNATPDSPEISLIRECGAFVDITDRFETTFHNFGRLKDPLKIDYIFTTKDLSTVAVDAHIDTKDGLYLTDHYIISAEIKR